MPISDNTLNSEQTLLWRTWREKSRIADRLAEKRMTVLFLVVGVILLACVLYYAFGLEPHLIPTNNTLPL